MGKQELDCRCRTCGRNITFDEVLNGYHEGHQFEVADQTAFMAVKEYLRDFKAIA